MLTFCRAAVFKEITAHARKVRLERFETPGAITLVQVSHVNDHRLSNVLMD